MKLKLFLEKINEMVKENQSLLELDVIYSEQNDVYEYNKIIFHPCVGEFDDEGLNFVVNHEKPNAICIN